MALENVTKALSDYMEELWSVGRRCRKQLKKDEYTALTGHIILNNLTMFMDIFEKKSTWTYTNLLYYIATAMTATNDTKERFGQELKNAWEEIINFISVTNLDPMIDKLFIKAEYELTSFSDRRERYEEERQEIDNSLWEKTTFSGGHL